MPLPAVGSHQGCIRKLQIAGREVLVFCGRIHGYEGYSQQQLLRLVHVAHEMGVKRLVVTNAAGGLNPMLEVGDVVALNNVAIKNSSSLEWHKRWVQGAWAQSCRFNEGSYVQVLGPSYETRAEIGMYRQMGYDVIGMSTMNEAKEAQKLGITTVACSLVTNKLSRYERRVLDHHDVVIAAEQSAERLRCVLETAISTCV